ncbi:hypothetical protein ACFL28_03980 [Candidatus Omnitrophota bacterium]
MKETINEEMFIGAVRRINRYLIILGIFFLIYFLLKTKVNVFLFILALANMAFALLSHKHLMITDRLVIELERAKTTLGDVARETREMHSG